jgi:hypothetical protein
MTPFTRVLVITAAAVIGAQAATAGKYEDTVALFRNAGESSAFFRDSYAYALFPTIGEGGLGIGAAGGKGHVYVQGQFVGDATMRQLSIGFQAGGKAYSEIIFFKDKRALEQFESGAFEFAAGASAVAITAGASVSAATDGVSSGASGGEHNASTDGQYNDGMAVFTIAKGGLMFAATLAGQKFSYKEHVAT